MARELLADDQLEAEIKRLSESEYVRLARKENRLKVEKQKQKLYVLRSLEKRGKELSDMGITFGNIKDIDYQDIKDKVPKPEDDPTAAAQAALGGIVPNEGNGDVIE